MKKLLTLALGVVVFAVFTGCAGQGNKGREKPALIPPPNYVTLSLTKNVASPNSCPVTARLGFSGNPAFLYPGYTVNFDVVSGPLVSIPSGVSDANGEVKRTIPRHPTGSRVIQATLLDFSGTLLLTSNGFTCNPNA